MAQKQRPIAALSADAPLAMIAQYCLGRRDDIDVHYLTSLATELREHGLTAFFLTRLLDKKPDAFDDQQKANINRYLKSLFASTLKKKGQLKTLCAALNEANIQYVLSKGSVWCHQYYSNPLQRPFTDFDLIIQNHDEAFQQALTAVGYDQIGELPAPMVLPQYSVTDTSGHRAPIDAHIEVTNSTIFRTVLIPKELIDRAQSLKLDGVSVPTLNDEDAFFHAVIHRTAHNLEEDRLIWLVDMVGITRTFDARRWQAIRAEAYRRGIGRLVDTHIQLLVRLQFIDTVELADLPIDNPRREHLSMTVHDTVTGYNRVQNLWINLRGLDNANDRLHYALQMAFPSRSYMLKQYGARGGLSLIVAYIKRILRRLIR